MKLWVVGVYRAPVASAGSFAAGADTGVGAVDGELLPFLDPTASGPLVRSVACVPNGDTAVRFDVALMRPAEQGFFDVALSFSDIFCSAKFDCAAEDLLFDETGQRARTMVLGFACTAGGAGDAETQLWLDDLELDCTDPSAEDFHADLVLNPAGAPGNQCAAGEMGACAAVTELGAVPADAVLYQLGLYRGYDGPGGGQTVYWNAALGVRPGGLACRLRARGTAAPSGGSTVADNGMIDEGVIYPVVAWDVPLGSCGSEALTFGDPAAPVRAEYLGLGQSAASRSFAYGYSRSFGPGSFCEPACAFGSACVEGVCQCPACDAPPGECWEPAGVCGVEGVCEYAPRAAGVACADDGEPCTEDACDGAGECAHLPGHAGVVCRVVAGPCDVAELETSCNATVAGVCGAANGGDFASAPSGSGLCSAGSASVVSGSGPYTWSCAGSYGGSTASSSANRSCGTQTLGWGSCSASASAATSGGERALSNSASGYEGAALATCTQGSWGLSETSCNATVNGACGSSNGGDFASAPSGSGLCSKGSASGVSGSGPYTWSCSGSYGGSTASCSADRSCTTQTVGWSSCSASASATTSGGTRSLSNTAGGYEGAATATCTQGSWSASGSCNATVNGACGSSNGGDFTSAPSGSGLCSKGSASVVSGSGPYTWSCSGSYGGSTASCSADRSCTTQTVGLGVKTTHISLYQKVKCEWS